MPEQSPTTLEEEAAEARALAELLTDPRSVEDLLVYASALEDGLHANRASPVSPPKAA